MTFQNHIFSQYPQAIIHVDGDAFFTSVEQAMHPALKNRPVVTGKERGIIACASYEAKRLGIKRGVSLWDARKICPHLVVLPSDYESYSIYSKRMFEIMGHYTPWVEESSIDEGFADISGLQRLFRKSYEQIACDIQDEIRRKLDISVSVGLSLSKTLAKLASDFKKPGGITPIPGTQIESFLEKTQLEAVCGFGTKTVQLMAKYGMRTAHDFIARPESVAGRLLGKIGRELWHELQGQSVYPVNPDPEPPKASISKAKTFTPSSSREFVYAQLIRNSESAFIKLRRHSLTCGEITIALRTQEYKEEYASARLPHSISSTHHAIPVLRDLFTGLFRNNTVYRLAMVVLTRIATDKTVQYELFEDPVRTEKATRLSGVVDKLGAQYGKHKVCLGTSLYLAKQPVTERRRLPWRKENLLPGETARKRLNLPRLDISV
jgi:DNA polymerase IV